MNFDPFYIIFGLLGVHIALVAVRILVWPEADRLRIGTNIFGIAILVAAGFLADSWGATAFAWISAAVVAGAAWYVEKSYAADNDEA